MEKKYCTAIVLAAGQGRRMGTKIQKQYLNIMGRPVLYYALQAFEKSSVVDDIILVTGEQEIPYCRKEIVERYDLKKVSAVIAGGKERYDSVEQALLWTQKSGREGYVMIHDGARPFVSEEIIRRIWEDVQKYSACTAGMPVKDTIKITDEDGFGTGTTVRSRTWQVQTPQAFSLKLILEAYRRMREAPCPGITDDTMLAEYYMGQKVYLTRGSYENIKITTPEDLDIAEIFVKKM